MDKTQDLTHLLALAETGAVLELDQAMKGRTQGTGSFTARAVVRLLEAGFGDQIVLGTDGARRSLWTALGGEPGLAWLSSTFPTVLAEMGVGADQLHKIRHGNARRVLTWRSTK